MTTFFHALTAGPFTHGLLFTALALFPVVNPLGMAPIFLNYTAGVDRETRIRLSRTVALNSFILATLSLVIGSFILKFFGLSLPAVRIAGGFVVAANGWRLLNQGEEDSRQRAPAVSTNEIMNGAFFPLTLPLTVGPGSITVMLTLGSSYADALANRRDLFEALGGILGIAVVAIVIFLCYRYAGALRKFLGASGVNVLLRLSAFILLCIGVQIALTGYRSFTQGS